MIQVIKYKCCGNIFAACCEPECYTDMDWLKELKKYVERGNKVEMIPNGGVLQFKRCECEKESKSKEQQKVIESLFDDEVLVLDSIDQTN
ncbi:hypothetical protein AB670_00053 [Chryseobacterium sp. MOF25P]|uniref:hypothetical protein n=1 Tax=unclassified Chryseobacterium TaxID=2593645 RepID=UPI0008050277|nr:MULTISPECIES: hypothetical protein [unclassified Chryseobacterium]OBW43523.1 hypothetical protein AB670_00053 [Chryseobacterium sp. MOF25P]OBW46703.1 hypothetical protein AB671_01198 [Chryseobacterium sp. BGARF1]